eukprot:CAMPEP_0113900892 /NCGR_PEP_ID=MMETSP0780_2-20120614/20942_1 /TAXON_ID=652834 /ORGANISM="Palpitomonas bilix" /LENGTH=196 /DNA_ID=CAMNT_0000893427 /DNA_START=51 /DNA_END=642 /DNA_ORIENTATION=+ /assembly_acc=CAM_ASM_000599
MATKKQEYKSNDERREQRAEEQSRRVDQLEQECAQLQQVFDTQKEEKARQRQLEEEEDKKVEAELMALRRETQELSEQREDILAHLRMQEKARAGEVAGANIVHVDAAPSPNSDKAGKKKGRRRPPLVPDSDPAPPKEGPRMTLSPPPPQFPPLPVTPPVPPPSPPHPPSSPPPGRDEPLCPMFSSSQIYKVISDT